MSYKFFTVYQILLILLGMAFSLPGSGQNVHVFEQDGMTFPQWINSNLRLPTNGSTIIRVYIRKSGEVDTVIVKNHFFDSKDNLIVSPDSANIEVIKKLRFQPLNTSCWVEFLTTSINVFGLYSDNCGQIAEGIHHMLRRAFEDEISTYFIERGTGEVLNYIIKEGKIVFAPTLKVTFDYAIPLEEKRNKNSELDFDAILNNIPGEKRHKNK